MMNKQKVVEAINKPIATYNVRASLHGAEVTTQIMVYPDEIEEWVLAEIERWAARWATTAFQRMQVVYDAFCMLWDAEIINQVHNMITVDLEPVNVERYKYTEVDL
jgi:hypothetical protein